ncbi:5'/3'-nucleotidase sure [Usnea florida]
MRVSTAHILTSLLPLLPLTSIALNIIVNNDDGFGAANIRELYRLLNAAGHNAWIVAPVSNQSGKGGTEVFTTEANLTAPSEYDLVPKGAPSFGTDPNDSHIWYYNGTPATCTFFALDYVVPNYWNGTKPDLLVSGPNFGDNLGPFLYTLSGTIGATYAAVERSLPAIAFSGGNGAQRSYKEINKTTPSGYPDPATIDAQLSVALVNQLAKNAKKSPLLPLAYGLSVNYPEITSFKNADCIDPPFIQTRMTGGAEVDTAVLDPATGLFSYGSIVPAGANTCINGDCSLPGETTVVGSGCFSSVSVFTVDYDAPSPGSKRVRKLLEPLVRYQNATRNSTASKSERLRARTRRAERLVGNAA